jgi:hypothetical protein
VVTVTLMGTKSRSGSVLHLVHRRQNRDLGQRCIEERVAVWLRARDPLGGEGAIRPDMIFDDELLMQSFDKPLRKQPSTHIARTSRGVWINKAHRPRGPIRGRGCATCNDRGGQRP